LAEIIQIFQSNPETQEKSTLGRENPKHFLMEPGPGPAPLEAYAFSARYLRDQLPFILDPRLLLQVV